MKLKLKIPLRLHRCSCNYKVRFGKSQCSYCFRPTPLWNRFWPWLIAIVGVILVLNTWYARLRSALKCNPSRINNNVIKHLLYMSNQRDAYYHTFVHRPFLRGIEHASSITNGALSVVSEPYYRRSEWPRRSHQSQNWPKPWSLQQMLLRIRPPSAGF